MNKIRCSWVKDNPLYIDYHDNEWGVPVYGDRLLFEFLILEGMQAGLNWLTILKKRDAYRIAFEDFNAETIVGFDEQKVNSLLSNAHIIRNRLKIASIISNAKALLTIQAELGSFSNYIWSFVGGTPIQNCWKSIEVVPTKTSISDALSKSLKQKGFKFVGSTICYAFMQAVGMVNDHTIDCFRYKIVGDKSNR